MVVSVHVRRAVARRPWLYWVGVAGGGALAAHVLLGQFGEAAEERRRWGEARRVAVTTIDGRAGESLTAVAWREVPVAVLPDAAVVDVAELDGAVLVHDVGRGEIVVAGDVTAAGPRARLEPGTAAVTVELVPENTPLRLGDPITVTSGGIVLSARATLVGLDGATAVLAVPAAEAAPVAAAARSGNVSIVLLP